MPSMPYLTELLPLTPGNPRAHAIARALEILRRGGVIAIPTETVYGLAGNARNPSAIARLRSLKGQPGDKPFQYLISSLAQAQKLCAPLSRTEKKLMRCFWPGPLTLVLKAREVSHDPQDGASPSRVPPLAPAGATLGLRLPDHPAARDLLRESGLILAATSANPHGDAPAKTAQEASRYFDGQIEAILDGGPAREGAASTVVEIENDEVRVLREGAISKATLINSAKFTVLFVSEENTVRAMLAAIIFRQFLALPASDVEIAVAANFFDPDGGNLPEQAARIMEDMGYPESPKRIDLTAQALDAADVIFVFNQARHNALAQVLPDAEQRLGLVDIGVDEVLAPRQRGVAIGPGYRETSVLLEKELWKTCKTLIKKMRKNPA